MLILSIHLLSVLLTGFNLGTTFSQNINSTQIKVRANNTFTQCTFGAPTPSYRDHELIVQSIFRSLQDSYYRHVWMSLVKQNYSLLIQKMKKYGPKRFIKKLNMHDKTFEGQDGKKLWNFTIQYMEGISVQDFLKKVDILDEDEASRAVSPTKYRTIPLPTDYWKKANPEYWRTYTDPPGLHPMRNTVPYANWHGLDYDLIWPKDPAIIPYLEDGRIKEWFVRPEWSSTAAPDDTPRPYTYRDYNKSGLWKLDPHFGLKIYTKADYYY